MISANATNMPAMQSNMIPFCMAEEDFMLLDIRPHPE
jgi:hypothetical protein